MPVMKKTKELCKGCDDDYYNQHEPNGCWSFEKAKLVLRTPVYSMASPPYKWEPKRTLSCWHRNMVSMICKEDPRVQFEKKGRKRK